MQQQINSYQKIITKQQETIRQENDKRLKLEASQISSDHNADEILAKL